MAKKLIRKSQATVFWCKKKVRKTSCHFGFGLSPMAMNGLMSCAWFSDILGNNNWQKPPLNRSF